ncbi:S-layer homology domain-containing protein [Bhargavaea ginsengi]|uniref:S-layer homology domain-containing protein n=1 Tax=Bhargavaea ginsengi TaxID=426757 RepID=UPI0020419481|nr:S-layer homology domain-containing protein [Bhargavaea ginsengi]MCM3089350.1 S-layer homology domain-containing protein [Bhargavaea ginsengi]
MQAPKRWVAISVATLVLLGTVVWEPGQDAAGNQQVNTSLYVDVPVSDTHFQNITEARTLGLMSGYPDNKFSPYQKLTRANVVKALGKYVEKTSGRTAAETDLSDVEPFLDVPPDHRDPELYLYSLLVKKEGVFLGSNNRLMPGSLIQRQQMAQVIVRAFGLQDLPEKRSRILDNKQAFSDAERRAIDILSKHDVTTVERFRPTETTNRGQLASFLVAAFHAGHEEFPPPVVTEIRIVDESE